MNMDNNNLTLLDVIDKNTLQSLQDAFAAATGMAALTVDETGPVTQGSNFTDFCMNLTRKSRLGCQRCEQCDLKGGDEASKTGRPAVYYCHGGLVDFAAPIMLNGRHIGSLIGGQVLPNEPDVEKFRSIAKEINVDPNEYIKALRKVKIVPKKQIDAAANLLYEMANALSEVGYQKLVAQQKGDANAETLQDIEKRLNSFISDIEKSAQAVRDLNEKFSGIKKSTADAIKAVKNMNDIVHEISSSSTRLTLIGFNASIEAKRAGKYGEGFNVIAQEVRNLAESNSGQVDEIEEKLESMRNAIDTINKEIEKFNAGIESTVEGIHILQNHVKETNKMLENIKN